MNGASTALVVLMAGLAAVVVAELGGTGDPDRANAGRAAGARYQPDPLPEPRVELPPLEALSATVERPLFRPSRRPAETAAAPDAALAEPTPALERFEGYELSGVVIAGEERVMLLRDARSARVLRVREGERVAGWSVERILPDRVVLRSADATDEVVLRRFDPAAPAPARPRAPAAPARDAQSDPQAPPEPSDPARD